MLTSRDAVTDELRDKVTFAKDGERGQNLPLRDAIKLASEHDVAVEFHCNAFSNPAASGVETLSHPDDFPLGQALCEAISDTLGIPNDLL